VVSWLTTVVFVGRIVALTTRQADKDVLRGRAMPNQYGLFSMAGKQRYLIEGLMMLFSMGTIVQYSVCFWILARLDRGVGLLWIPVSLILIYLVYKLARGELRTTHPISSPHLHLAFSLLYRTIDKILVSCYYIIR